MRLAWILLAAATVMSSGAAPAKKLPKTDRLWIHPEVASFNLERIAVLPAATFDHNPDVAKQVEVAFAQVFQKLPYRWISPGSSREVLRARAGGRDSLLDLMRSSLLASGRVDSLLARELCGMMRCDAVLSLRVDQWERRELEWNEAGKPSTTVRVTAALVDTIGRLAWSATGLERGEGSTNDPSGNVSGVKASGLDTKPIKAEAGAPKFQEVLLPLFTRWFEFFPAPASKPAG